LWGQVLRALNKLGLPQTLANVVAYLIAQNAHPVLVGGSVRDWVMGGEIKDWDIEVFGVNDVGHLLSLLSYFGEPIVCGKSFGVIKLPHLEADFSLPRLEKKVSKGHKGFRVTHEPALPFEIAAKRRDFTMNSMGFEFKENRFLDPYEGRKDIEAKKIRHVSEAFSEDPLRVLRAVQFAARFAFDIAPETIAVCKNITRSLVELPKERLFGEIKKWLLLSEKPSLGLVAMRETHALSLFPELAELMGRSQDPSLHTETDVWGHAAKVLDLMALQKGKDPDENLILMLAALCHEMEKPHLFLRRFTDQKSLISPILTLIKTQEKPLLLYQTYAELPGVAADSALRRLSICAPISRLVKLLSADCGASNPALAKNATSWLVDNANRLGILDTPPAPIIQGHHLVALGVVPGKPLGNLLKKCFRWQINGKFDTLEGGIKKIKHFL